MEFPEEISGDEEREALASFYRSQVTTYQEKANYYLSLVKKYTKLLEEIDEKGLIEASARKAGFDQKWPWLQKIRFILFNQGEYMTSRQIVDTLKSYQPSVTNPIKSISATISQNSGQDGELHKYSAIDGNNYVGLKEWEDITGHKKIPPIEGA